MTKEVFEDLVAVEGANGDIYIIAVNLDKIAEGKIEAQKLYRDACEEQTIVIDDWVDSTDCVLTNFESIDDLEGCELLEDIEQKGYVISID